MKSAYTVLGTGLALAALATPILAQRDEQDRKPPSRQCIREYVQMCGTDRSQIPACVRENAQNLSKKCQKDAAKRFADRSDEPSMAKIPFQRTARPTQSILYGDHQRQQIDIYEPASAVDPEPLILFVHGGGWTTGNHKRVWSKPVHFGESDIFFASTGYRVLPDAPVEQQARDIGLALQALVDQADLIGFDPERVVLMGHSSGAHLAALVATDPQYAGKFTSIVEDRCP